MSDATVKLMDITSDMSSALRAGADDGRATQRNGKEQTMKALIGFWLICEAVTFLILWLSDLDDKAETFFAFTTFVTTLAVGSYLIAE